jgi:hypothetical protein
MDSTPPLRGGTLAYSVRYGIIRSTVLQPLHSLSTLFWGYMILFFFALKFWLDVNPLAPELFLTHTIPSGVPPGPQTVIFCDPVITITTDVLLIFVCVRHQLKINIM